MFAPIRNVIFLNVLVHFQWISYVVIHLCAGSGSAKMCSDVCLCSDNLNRLWAQGAIIVEMQL